MNKILPGQTYMHFKGTLHKVLHVALNSETLEKIEQRADNITNQTYKFELVSKSR